ncbi:LIC_10461 domain-containing protein, partial [Leptospira interrogans]
FGIYSLSDSEEASCQDNPGEVKMVRTIPDTMIHFFAGPFYTSRTVEVYCPLAKEEEKKNEVVKTIPKENQDGKEAVKPNSSPVPDRPKPKDQFEAQEMSENTKEPKEKPKQKKNNVFDSQF